MTNAMDKVSFSVQYTHLQDKMFHFIVLINGEAFQYSKGLGYATQKREKNKTYAKISDADGRAALGKKYEEFTNCYVSLPTLDSVLESLFLDASAYSESFDSWCSNCGYDSDSIKALNMYQACCENGKKLRKALGTSYHDVARELQAKLEGE